MHGPLHTVGDVLYLLGVGVFPSQDPVQPRMPPWIYNESLVPGKKSFFAQDAFKCCNVVVSVYYLVATEYAEEIITIFSERVQKIKYS